MPRARRRMRVWSWVSSARGAGLSTGMAGRPGEFRSMWATLSMEAVERHGVALRQGEQGRSQGADECSWFLRGAFELPALGDDLVGGVRGGGAQGGGEGVFAEGRCQIQGQRERAG